MSERSFAPSVAPGLVLTIDGADRTLRPASYRVGRDPEADIVVTGPQVSWNHAVLQAEGDAWFVEDCGSRNGTFVGSDRVGHGFEILGLVPQDDVIYPKLTPRRFLSYAAELKLSPGRTRRRCLRDAFGGRSGDRGRSRRGR